MYQASGPAVLGGESVPLGNYGDRETIPGQSVVARAARRSARELLKVVQRRLTESVSSQGCGLPIGGDVVVEITTAFVSHVCRVAHCGSPWSCPVCGPIIRQVRRAEIDLVVEAAAARGWSSLFGVWTLRHHAGDRLASTLPHITSAIHDSLQGRTWCGFKEDFGYVGLCKTIEVDWSAANGYHPHGNGLLIFRNPLAEDDVNRLERWWFSRWDRIASRAGFGPLVPGRGLYLERPETALAMGEYMTKSETTWGLGAEMTRGDLKRHGELVSIFRVLEEFAATGDFDLSRVWLEYEAATKNRRFMYLSAAVRRELLGVVPEVTDEEAAASEGVGEVIITATFGAQVWRLLVLSGERAAVLTELEEMARVFVFMAQAMGHEVPVIEWTEEKVGREVQRHHAA